MPDSTSKIFSNYEQEVISEDIANQIEANLKEFFEIIISWQQDTG